jgi:hypothetical protein
MGSFLGDAFEKMLRGFGQRVQAFGPDLMGMLAVLVLGVLAAALLRAGLRRLLPRLGFDSFAAGLGLTLLLDRGGARQSPAELAASASAWAAVIVAALAAVGTLNVQVASDLVARAFAYLPQLIVALAVLLAGLAAAAFARRSILIAAVNAGVASARLLATSAEIGVAALSAAIALEHVGVGREIIVASFTILFGGIVFALSLAFGLAGRELARQVLEDLARRARQREGPLQHL